MSITLAEIAEKAGVTHGVVSLVLRDKAKNRVSAAKQQLIRDLASQYNYRPNMAARGLRKQRQYTIGVAMPSSSSRFYGEMVARIQHHLTQKGYVGIFAFWESLEEVGKTFGTIFARGVDGIVSWEHHESLEREGVPSVLYETAAPGNDSVRLDHDYFARTAIGYLTGLGHRRIGYMGDDKDPRFKSIRRHMREQGLELNPSWILDCKGTLEGGAQGMARMRSGRGSRPTAIIAHNDALAMGAMFEARRSGARVPEDISIVGFDGMPEGAYCHPRLTTFDLKLNLVAESLVGLMLKRLDCPDRPAENKIIRPELIIRESCAKPNNNGA